MKNYILNRLREPSTWRGLCWILVGAGVGMTSEQVNAFEVVGPAIIGALGALIPDKA